MGKMSETWSKVVNGERVVVMLLVTRIITSAPFPLLSFECISLSFLSLFALLVEISLEASSSPSPSLFLLTRPGASSGILLGAVTLPGVMFSKLIQMSRGLEMDDVALSEFQYQKVLYWATFMSCFAVLLFLGLVIHCSSSCKVVSKFSCLSMMLCTLVYMTVPAFGSNNGLPSAIILLWLIGHGVAAVKLIQYTLRTFPSCASIGEALLVTTGLVTYSGDMLRATFVKAARSLVLSEFFDVQNGIKRSEISTLIQGYLLGLLLLPLLYKFSVQVLDSFTSSSSYSAGNSQEYRRSFLFFALLIIVCSMIIPLWMQFIQEFQEHPLWWIITFVFSEPLKRLSLCLYWIGIIYVSVRRFYNISKSSKVERILLRKYYHLMAVSMFVPALIFQPSFLKLAFGAALAAFLVLEIIRVWTIWPLGELIHQFMSAFTDHRDSDLLIVSHFSLLLGCALPIWMSSGYNDRPLAPFAGILSLGIGDTMASMVGYKYGVLRWSKSGKKTVEGTAAGITSVLVACSFLLPLLASTGYIQNWSSLLLAVIASGLLEAYTAQLDNAFIPLAFYSLLCV